MRHSLEISNQSQLDALEGCERVAGDLLLRVFPGIDEMPLLSLTDVDGSLEVSADQPVDDPLEGLRSLEEAGELILARLNLSNLERLARLRVVSASSTAPDTSVYVSVGDAEHNALKIIGCSGLQDLSGLSGLRDTPRIQLQGNPELTSLSGLTGLAELDALDVTDCPLSTLAGLPPVRVLSVTGSGLTDLEGLGTATPPSALRLYSNPLLTSLEGGALPAHMDEITLQENPRLSSLRGLEELRSLAHLSIYNHLQPSALTSLAGLDGLEQLGYADFSGQSRLSHLDGLDAVVHLEQLRIEDCGGLQDLRGLQHATTSSLTILRAAQLATLQGMPRLGPHAGFGLRDVPMLEDIGPLVASADLSVLIVRSGVRDLTPLGDVETLAGLDLEDNPQLRSLPQLNASSPFAFTLRNDPALELWPGLTPPIEQAGDMIVAGTGLRDLAWLSGLQSAGDLEIRDNPHLARLDLPDLRRARSIYIEGNPKLDDAGLRALIGLGSSPPGDYMGGPPFVVDDNLSGTAPLAQCPFQDDGICDEELGTCVAGSDAADCAP